MKIGFIGLGIMGKRMTANLQKNGCELVVYNRSKEKAANLLRNGAVWAGSPAESLIRSNSSLPCYLHLGG